MYNERPDQIVNRHKKPVTLVQIFSALIIVMISFVLPVQLFELHKSQTATVSPYSINATQTGRVAGASTSQPTSTQTAVFQQSETQTLLVIAGILLTVGVAIMVYLFASKPKHSYPAPSPSFNLD